MIFRFYLGLIKLIKYNLCKFVLQLHIFVTNVPYHNNKCHVFLFCLSSCFVIRLHLALVIGPFFLFLYLCLIFPQEWEGLV